MFVTDQLRNTEKLFIGQCHLCRNKCRKCMQINRLTRILRRGTARRTPHLRIRVKRFFYNYLCRFGVESGTVQLSRFPRHNRSSLVQDVGGDLRLVWVMACVGLVA